MNKKILLGSLFLATNLTFAQSLLNENFDSYTLGNVGTDLTAKTPGQGDWFLYGDNTNVTPLNFQIASEKDKGNVYKISSTNNGKGTATTAKNLKSWLTRDQGNDVLKIEYEFYAGSANGSEAVHEFVIGNENEKVLGGTLFDFKTGELFLLGMLPDITNGSKPELNRIRLSQKGVIAPKDEWIKVTLYLNFKESQLYYDIPSLGEPGAAVVIFLTKTPAEVDLIAMDIDYTSTIPASVVKYDNINISAVKQVTLGVNDVVSTKFNVYPNPASDIITIANNESIGIEKVSIIDINGRVVKTQSFANESEIQLNISDLKAGVYIFNVSTKEGTATKKIIKK